MANHDVECLHPQMTQPRWMDGIAAVVAERLAALDV